MKVHRRLDVWNLAALWVRCAGDDDGKCHKVMDQIAVNNAKQYTYYIALPQSNGGVMEE